MNVYDGIIFASQHEVMRTECVVLQLTKDVLISGGFRLPAGMHILTHTSFEAQWDSYVTRSIDPDGKIYIPSDAPAAHKDMLHGLLRDCPDLDGRARALLVGVSQDHILRYVVTELRADTAAAMPVQVIRPFDREPARRVFEAPRAWREDIGQPAVDVAIRPTFDD